MGFFYFILALVTLKLGLVLTLPLIDDETYHWTWAKNPALSYFDHPGLIAWVEAISTGFFGDGVFAIRLPAFLFYLGILYFLYKTAEELFDYKVARLAVVLFSVPPLWMSSFVAAPELPFVFFWVLAVYIFVRSLSPMDALKPSSAWLLLGVVFGLGINAKFPLFLLSVGMGLFLLLDKKHRPVLYTPWPWLGLGIASVLALPIFVWNSQHGWASFLFQFSRRHSDQVFSVDRFLGFLAAQAGLMSPVLYVAILIVFVLAFLKWQELPWRLILCLVLPSLVMFYYQPFFAEYKPHWSGPAYLLLLILVSRWLGTLRIQIRNILLGLIFMTYLGHVVVYTAIYDPLVARVHALMGKEYVPVQDFTNEMHGWDELGEWVQGKLQKNRQEGEKVFLASWRYELVARLWYHGGERSYNISREIDQFHFWQTADHMETLKGAKVLFLSTDKYNRDPMTFAFFQDCKREELKTYRKGFPSRTFFIDICTDFQGERP